MKGQLKITVDAIVGGQDCGSGYDAEDLEAISKVFSKAATHLRQLNHGEVVCETSEVILACVHIDRSDVEYDSDKGMPILERVVLQPTGRGRKAP